jgi:hypothetical protein
MAASEQPSPLTLPGVIARNPNSGQTARASADHVRRTLHQQRPSRWHGGGVGNQAKAGPRHREHLRRMIVTGRVAQHSAQAARAAADRDHDPPALPPTPQLKQHPAQPHAALRRPQHPRRPHPDQQLTPPRHITLPNLQRNPASRALHRLGGGADSNRRRAAWRTAGGSALGQPVANQQVHRLTWRLGARGRDVIRPAARATPVTIPQPRLHVHAAGRASRSWRA